MRWDLAYRGLEVSTQDMENVDLYLHTLGVPARRNVNDPEVKRGEQMFYQAKCHLCHVTTLRTRPRGATLLAGTELPWLGNQTIHPYSDYLLHDMGSEIMGVGLNDNYVSGLARGCEWRTTPLWGVGLQEKVDGHTYFLHDGRARNFTEAILWHGGEGEASKRLFMKMPKKDRQALLKFLEIALIRRPFPSFFPFSTFCHHTTTPFQNETYPRFCFRRLRVASAPRTGRSHRQRGGEHRRQPRPHRAQQQR